MPISSQPRIAVLGAGPIGLEAALYARKLGYAVQIYEAGEVGEHLRRWGHVRLFSPFAMNCTSLGKEAILGNDHKHPFPDDGEYITGRDLLETYLEPLSQSDLLRDSLHTQTRVMHISRRGLYKSEAIGDPQRGQRPFRMLLLEEKKREKIGEADIVLDCTGTYGQPRWMGNGGIPAIGEKSARSRISYFLEDIVGKRQEYYAGKNILVVGAGYSAATTVSNLAKLSERHPDTWVIWAARGKGSQPIQRIAGDSLKERDRLAVQANKLATRSDDNVEFHPQTTIEAIDGDDDKGFRVKAKCGDAMKTWEVERIIANVGYTPNSEMYRELQIHECYATLGPIKLAATLLSQTSADCLKQTSPGPEVLKNPEPGYFILGAKSYGRNSLFLLRIGFEQICDVFRIITQKPDLNLYR